jgi:penicillin G amidase
MPSSTLPRRLRTIAILIVAVLAAAALAAAGWGTWTVRRSFPQVEGSAVVPGVSAPVDVVRDAHGVPRVYADNAADLFRAQGYVQAQDRFWEMDFRRHASAGRLAELFGPSQVRTDTLVRTLGWRRTAEREVTLLAPASRRYLDAYAEGVNAYLEQRQGAELSVEHGMLTMTNAGYRPQPWTPADSVAWLKAMAWDLRSNTKEEIERSVLAAGLPVERVEQLYPSYPFDRHPAVVRGGAVVKDRFDPGATPPPRLPRRARAELAGTARLLDRMPALLGPNGRDVGSNSWVVAGSRSATGRPLLANDPHLGPALPATWYQMGLHCRAVSPDCPFDVAGVSFAGVPGVVIGHNAEVAWGFTNLPADVTDLYLERIEGERYRYDGRLYPLETRQEVIDVAGAAPVTVTVRSTRHGPLLSDVDDRARAVGERPPAWLGGRPKDPAPVSSGGPAPSGQPGYGVALRWTASEPSHTMDAIFAIDTARNWKDFRAAARLLTVPAQNLVYADTSGNIGYQMPGAVPVRRKGDGRWPVPGWDSDYEWRGTIPFEELPHVYNPPSGYVVTANNAVADPTYPHLITTDWDHGYRAKRIDDLLVRAGKLDVTTMQRLQSDTYNPIAEALVPRLLAFRTDPFTRDGQKLLVNWDFTQPADSAAAAYFNAVWRQVLALTFHDEMPPEARPDGGDRWFEVVRRLLVEPADPWWDDMRTLDRRETRDEILQLALRDARLELTARLGKGTDTWEWGRLHQLRLRDHGFGQPGAPGPVRALVNPRPVPLGGGNAVNAVGWDAAKGYQVDLVPSVRLVMDVGQWDASRWVIGTGVSGHAFHPHSSDQAAVWRAGRALPFAFRREALPTGDLRALRLTPEGP